MTLFDFLIIVLSALTLHRVWNYENITKKLRQRIDAILYIRKVFCPPCSALWIGLASVLLWSYTPFPLSAALAAYMPTRLLVWVYARMAPPIVASTDDKAHKPAVPVPPKVNPAAPAHGAVKAVMPSSAPGINQPVPLRTVIIMTALGDFRPSYSVATAVLDQAAAIGLTHPDWQVEVWVMVNADLTGFDVPPNVVARKVIPLMPWIENITSNEKSAELRDVLLSLLAPFRGTTIITHDLMFVTWYTLFAHAIHLVGDTGGHRWFHIPHSLPSSREGKSKYITTMPAGSHHVVTVARGFEGKFADYYQIPVQNVHRIPNVRDPRTWGTMTPRVRHIITKTRLWERDWVQTFPICTTRLEAKGFSKVVRTFAMLNESGKNAFLLVCNPNAGGGRSIKIIAEAKNIAAAAGLKPDQWAFTSDLAPDSATFGLSADEMKTLLYGYSNLLLFPSMAEADSLILREAQLANLLVVGNEDVSTLSASEDSDMAVHWGTTDEVSDPMCRFVANHLMDRGIPDKLRRRVLRTRNLEGIGHQWGSLITLAGPTSSS